MSIILSSIKLNFFPTYSQIFKCVCPNKCRTLYNSSYLLKFRSKLTKNLLQNDSNLSLVNIRKIPMLKTQLHQISSQSANRMNLGQRSTLYYLSAIGVLVVGLSYAAVPLYRIFCQAYSYGGTVGTDVDNSKVEQMTAVKERLIKIRFNADTAAAMTWNFKPQQTEIQVSPGETALAFYTAKNPTDRAVIGVSTYNVIPFEAGEYFNKIQCFCFEEQMLNPREEVHMPVFFYIDPDFALDPRLENVDEITLSYTFFEAKEGMKLPFPGFPVNRA